MLLKVIFANKIINKYYFTLALEIFLNYETQYFKKNN